MALWPKFDKTECAAFRRVVHQRRLSNAHFYEYDKFDKLLDDRQLMSAFIHVSGCLNPLCQKCKGRVQDLMSFNAEIGFATIGRMELWRSKVEGWPPKPTKERSHG